MNQHDALRTPDRDQQWLVMLIAAMEQDGWTGGSQAPDAAIVVELRRQLARTVTPGRACGRLN
jgi:hypothetical protein